MIDCSASECRIGGEITLANAASLLNELKPHLAQQLAVLDFSTVTYVDSSALALILSCLREAEQYNYQLRFSGFPPSMTKLADLYGLAPLLQT